MNRLLAFCCALGWFGHFISAAAEPDLAADGHTVFLLQVDRAKGGLVDRTGRFTPTVAGGIVLMDETWGACLELGDGAANGIALKDDGKIDFAGGMTLDAWLYFEESPAAKSAPLALKSGSFSWEIAKGKLNTAWLVFPSEPIFTTTPQQFKYFPVGGDMINGFMQVPVQKWVHLTMAYDEALGTVTTRIDGMTDRQRYRYRGPERLQCDGYGVLTLFQGFRHCRVGAVRLNTGRPHLTPASLEAYVTPLPYQGKMMVTLDHIDPELPLPIEVTLVGEKASGEAATLERFALDSHEKKVVLLDLPTWKNSLHTCW